MDDNYKLEQFLNEKNDEIQFLENFYFRSKNQLLIINGPKGIGKSSLIYGFIRRNNKRLKGEFKIFHDFNLKDEMNIFELLEDKSNLIILEDFDQGNLDLSIFIQKIIDRNSRKKVIITSQNNTLVKESIIPGRFDIINVSGISQRLLKNLIYNYFPVVNREQLYNKFKDNDLLGYFNGNLRSIEAAVTILNREDCSIEELKRRIDTPIKQSGLIDIYGNPLSTDSVSGQLITTKIHLVNNSLLEEVFKDPGIIYNIEPRQFEILVAELLEREGFNVDLTKTTRDGGKDIIIAENRSIGKFLFYVECKRYSPTNHVGINLIKLLSATVDHDRATAGLLVTTSFFTPDAIEFAEEYKHRLSLMDYYGLNDWIKNVYLKNFQL